MDDQQRRASTETIFRAVNERIAETARRFGAERARFLCECSDGDCTARVAATLVEYEQLRADGAGLLVAPGHLRAEPG